MIFLVFLLVVFVFAVRLIYDSLHQNFPEHELSGEDNLEEGPKIAHKLIIEQVQLWDYEGPKTGAYYAQQHNWTIRARNYVARLRDKIKKEVI